MSVENTVFISYRRANSAHALLINEKLKDNNFDVFLDVNSLASGAYGQAILNQIAARAHFIVILTPSTVERCAEPGDWIRKEVEQAIELKRNIVPIMFDSFNYDAAAPYLTGKLAVLPQFNSIPVDYNYFDAVIDKLVNQFLNIPLDLVLHPTPSNEKEVVKQSIEGAENLPTPTSDQLQAERYFESGVLKMVSFDLGGAITDLDEAIRLNPKFDEAYYQRGRAYANKLNKEKAIADWEQAIRLEPDDIRANITRSCIFRNKGNYTRALVEADAGVTLNPKDSDAYFQRGNVKRCLKDWDGAIDDYSRAIKLNPKNALLYFVNRALTLNDKGNHAEAIEDLTSAIKLKPDFARSYNSRGFTYYRLNDLDNALADCLKSVEIDPNKANSQDSLGQIYFARGELQAAFDHYSKAHELDPDTEFIIAGLAISNYAIGNHKKALELWRGLIAKDPQYKDDPRWLKEKFDWHRALIAEAQKLVAQLNN